MLPILTWSQSTTVSFCDGDDLFLISDADCTGGINFGERKPECVCISGVYRSWTQDCSLYDGFVHEYCAPLWVEEDDGYNVQGLRLIPGIGNIYNDTVAVFGSREIADFRSWNAIAMGMNGKTWSDTFYVLNGFPVMLMKKNDKFICVEPSPKAERQVCRYFASDNIQMWEPGEGIRILLMETCEVKGYDMSELAEHHCYDIMNMNVSECQLPCTNGKVTYIPGSLPGLTREKKSVGGSNGNEVGSNDLDEESMVGSSIIDVSGADPPSTKAENNANFFLHRKLNKFTRLRQTGQLGRLDLSQAAPNRTFILLDIAKRIVRGFCPANLVSDLFLDAALELFVVLHKGQDFRFIEDLPQRDFQWIKDILMRCRKRSPDPEKEGFYTKDKDGPCKDDDFIVEHKFIQEDIEITIPLNRSVGHDKGKYHFVIDAVWLMIDLTHSLCFSSFAKSFRMFHVWEQASEKLFTRDIRNLWFNPKVELTVYNALLSNRALVDMVNLDRCTEAAYKRWIMPELTRPAPMRAIFKRRKREALHENKPTSLAKSVDVYCAKEEKDVIYNC